MKYENVSQGILKFRAHNKKGIVKEFILNPGKKMESDREVSHPGLEKIKDKIILEKKIKKIIKKESDINGI